jgi:hypothetical protein
MSGGHFDYDQYRIGEIADDIEVLIENNGVPNDNGYARNFSTETIVEFKAAVRALRIAEVYAHRIDWLVSCDDGEEEFHHRLAVDLSEIV